MKPKATLRSFLALAGSSLLAMSSAHAAIIYWDTNNTTAGLGNTAGTWGSSALSHSFTNPEGRLVFDGTYTATSDLNGTSADTFYFGSVNMALGAAASTIGIDGTNVAAARIVFGAGQGSQGVTLSSGGGIITIAGAGAALGEIVSNNTGTNTIGAQLAGANGLAVYGPGTLLLTGANSFTSGLVIRNGGTLQVGNGTTGSLISQNLTFKFGGGAFNVRAVDTGSTQAMGALLFSSESSAVGESTVQSTYGTSGNAVLSFTSLGARGAGSTGNFVVSGGSNGTTNKIVLTGATANAFIDKGLFFGGSEYAAYDSGGFVRAFNYASDTDASAVDTITASKHVKLTASPAARTGDTLLSLNLSGGGVDYTMNAGSLTVPAILKSGGGTVSTISGGTSVTTASNAELVIRTDTSSDLLTISSAVTGFSGGLTKTGAGTLTLSNTNGYTGTTNINAGTLEVSGGNAIANANTVNLANAAGATFKLSSNETINILSGGGFSGGNVNVGANTLTIGATSTFGGQFSGTSAGSVTVSAGTLTLSNKNTFLGAINLNGTSQLSFTYGNDGTSSALALSSGGAINMAGGTTLNFTPGGNSQVGIIGSQLIVGSGWNIGNDIKVTSGTANITFGASNNSIWTFNGGVSGSSTPATPTTLAVTTHNTTADSAAISFAGVIQDGSGGSLGLNLKHADTSAAGFFNLTNSNTFTGAIAMSTVGTTNQNGFLVIGGTRTINGFTTGSGSLGSGGIYSNTISLTPGAGVSILNYASSANQTLGGIISGTNGQLLKDGAGTLTLSVANSYTGATTVNAGRLHVTGSLTSAVTVANTATLSGTGSTSSTLALSAGSTIVGTTAGSSFQANTVTATSVTIAGSDGSGTIGGHTIGVVRYATGTGPTTLNFSTAGYHAGATVTNVGGSGGETQLTYTNAARTWNSASGTWDVMNATPWQEGDLKFGQGDAVTFDDTGTGGGSARTVTLNSLVTPGSVTFNNSTTTPYTVSGTGTIHGLTALTKSGTGTVTLSNANTYTGATTVNGGALLVNGSTHASSAVTVAAGTATGTPLARLGGTGTIGANVSLTTESAGGFKNGGVLAPTAATSGTALKVTGTTTFTTGSLFEWNMSATAPATDPGVVANSGSYGQLAGTGAITGSNAVFNIVLGVGNAFTDNFWNSDKSWTNVFTGSGATNTLTSMFASFGGDVSTAGVVAGEGSFSFTGTSTLNWTYSAVPEPTSALAGLLLTAGLLRRRRNQGRPVLSLES